MTHNQIAYQSNLLQEAHNLEEARHNRENEATARYVAEIQALNNQMQNTLNTARLNEESRHNREQEAIGRMQANLASGTLLLNSRIADESARHNLATESENQRHSEAVESETSRTNRAREIEENRSNLAREAETSLHNRRSDFINAVNAGTNMVNSAFRGFSTLIGALNPFQLLQ